MTGPHHRIGRWNARLQVLAAVGTNRRTRRREGVTLAEGRRAVQAAVAGGCRLPLVLWPTGTSPPGWAMEAAAWAESTAEVAPGLYARLSSRDEPPEALAVVEIPRRDLGAPDRPVVVLDRPRSPGNLGSIVRTADALGAAGVVVSGHAADPWDPRAVRASRGAVFVVPVVEVAGPGPATALLEGRALVGTDPRAPATLDGARLPPGVAVVFGTEATGLSRAWRERLSTTVAIPAGGVVSSLNVAAAAAIVLWELRPSRGDGTAPAAPGPPAAGSDADDDPAR